MMCLKAVHFGVVVRIRRCCNFCEEKAHVHEALEKPRAACQYFLSLFYIIVLGAGLLCTCLL